VEQPFGDAPAYPAQRAFVVQLHATADLAQGQVVGRVEHVLSGQATRFVTLDALLAFMVRVVAAVDQAPPAEG
jgi:hypothetical protein